MTRIEREKQTGNDFNLNESPFLQSLYSNSRSCRVWLCEKLCINSVHICKVIHISHEYCYFHDIAHCQTCLFQDSLHVEQRLASLFLDSSLNKTSSSRVDGYLSRGINEIANLYCLTITSYWLLKWSPSCLSIQLSQTHQRYNVQFLEHHLRQQLPYL